MQAIARIGFILIGVSGIIGALASLPRMLDYGMYRDLSTGAALSWFGLWVVAAFLPPAALLYFSAHLARASLPGQVAPSSLDAPALVTAGTAVLGIYFLVTGITGILSAVATAPFAVSLEAGSWRIIYASLGSALRVLFGFGLFFWAPQIVTRLSARWPAA